MHTPEDGTDDTKTFLVFAKYLQGLICEVWPFSLIPGDTILFSGCEPKRWVEFVETGSIWALCLSLAAVPIVLIELSVISYT